MTLAASALVRTFCATSTRSSIEMGRPDGPCRSPPADVSLERHASGEGPDETTRRRADASRVRIPVPVVPVRSWPKWSRRIPTRIAHGIGHGHARVFMESLWQQGVTGTVNETGFFTTSAGGFTGAVSDETCGTLTTTSATLTFSGSTARISESATSEFCGSIQVSGTLTR